MFSQTPLTCRPLLSELNVSLLLLNIVTRPPWSQNCLSLQRPGSGHEVRIISVQPWMTRMETRSEITIIVMENGELSQDAEIKGDVHRPRDKGNNADDDHSYPTQHCPERVTLLPESGPASKIPTFLDKFSSLGSFSHIHEIINYIFGLLFCNLYINIVNNYG